MKLKRNIVTILTAFILTLTAVTGSAASAVKSKAKARQQVDMADLLRQAETSIGNYDFEAAVGLLDEYKDTAEKNKKPVDSSYDDLRRRASLGLTMLGRIEKIAIIDSLTVDSAAFFNAYRLSVPSGYIADSEVLPVGIDASGNPTVFVSESGETMIWSAPEADGRQLVESHLLADGSWETPQPLGGAFSEFDSPAYPFLMADGSTLYFAAKGDESLGGYDIFIARNNGDEYLQPQNMGMPYNSPFNDYMLAIDEVTGAGWWATDRNRIEGKITIYVFIPQELRVNYPPDAPDLAKRAFITDISTTGDRETYADVLDKIAALDREASDDAPEFQIAMPGGKIYTSMDDFHSSAAVDAMRRYLDARDRLIDDESVLEDLRLQYAGGLAGRNNIIRLENSIESQRLELKRLANEVAKAEGAR